MKTNYSKIMQALLSDVLKSAIDGKALKACCQSLAEKLSQIIHSDFVQVFECDKKGKLSSIASCGDNPKTDKKITLFISESCKTCNKNQFVFNEKAGEKFMSFIAFECKKDTQILFAFLTEKTLSKEIQKQLAEFMNNLKKINQLFENKEFFNLLKKQIVADEKQTRIDYLANYDVLTNLPNRALFLKKLHEIQKNKAKFFAVLFIDLAAFNRFNNTLGHDSGDAILKMQAQRLLSCLSPKDFLARIEGDEFGIILQNISTADSLHKYAKQILKTLEMPLLINDKEICLNSYLGISIYPNDAKTADDLINFADMALFEAKKIGINHYAFYSDRLNCEAKQRIELENDMRKAIQEHQFFVEYQPQLDIKTERIIGFEALVRWKHPLKGIISPVSFIPIAEETGLIIPLTNYIMKIAFEQSEKWNDLKLGKLTVAVNLSAAQFDNPKTILAIKDLIKNKHINPKYIELELTESLLMKHLNEASDLLKELSDLGIHLAMDDFGTGYSSLSYLNQLPFHKLKIDRSFIAPILKNKQNKEIVKAIINLGHTIGLSVLAEGCENKKQFDVLKAMDCDSIQGFYLSKSLSSEDAEQLLYKYNQKQK